MNNLHRHFMAKGLRKNFTKVIVETFKSKTDGRIQVQEARTDGQLYCRFCVSRKKDSH